MALPTTLSLVYQLLQTGTRTRREIFSDLASYSVGASYTAEQITMAAEQVITLSDIAGLFVIKPDAPLNVQINGGSAVTLTDAMIIFGPISAVIITNPSSTSTVDCFLCYS